LPAAFAFAGIQAAEDPQIRKAAVRNILLGGMNCFLGIGVSLASVLLAVNAPGGGKFYVTSGLIVSGAILLLRGFSQLAW